MVEVRLKNGPILVLVSLMLCLPASQASEENDLWLLLSSYEDIGITVQDLAFFLVTHGYNAKPVESYVTITFTDGKEVYLTPNGASPRLADLWMTPPSAQTGPMQVISSDAIKINITYKKTGNADFIKTINRDQMFPLTPLGMCYDGSQTLSKSCKSFGYNTIFMYDPSGFDSQGHLWVVVEDKDHAGTWLAVDSYYGVVNDDSYYYTAPYSFADFKYLDSITPKWKTT